MPVGYITISERDLKDPTLSTLNMTLRQHTDELNRLGGLNGEVTIESGIDASGPVTCTVLNIGPIQIISGAGSPQGKVAAPLGSLYSNINGGANTTLWVKESGGNSNTGWVAK